MTITIDAITIHITPGTSPDALRPIMDILTAMQRTLNTMPSTLADLDAEIQTLTTDEATAAATITKVLTDLQGKVGQPAPDLTSEIAALQSLDTAFSNVEATASADDAPPAPPAPPVGA